MRTDNFAARAEKIYTTLAFFIPFVAYALTTPKDLTKGIFGSDSGELITASITGGVSHPPGYPTWLILSRAFAQLPIGQTLAHRYNFFSVVCMSLAMLVLYLTVRKALGNDTPTASITPLVSVLTVAFGLTVWSQAVITEVYALNALMVCVTLFLLATIEFEQPPSWLIGLAGLTAGIAATTHLTSVFLLPLALLVCRKRLPTVFLFGLGFIVGLSPFLLIFLRAGSASPIVWGTPGTLSGWWWLISGEIYRANVLAKSAAEVVDRVRPFIRFSGLSPELLIPIGAIMGLILGIGDEEHKSRNLFSIGCLTTALCYAVYALSYGTGDWRVFLMPINLFLALPLAVGIQQFNWWGLLLPILMVMANLPAVLDAQSDSVRAEGMRVMEEAPQNAILLTNGKDDTLFPIWYFRYAEEHRPDTVVVDYNMFAFDWYRNRLAAQNPDLLTLEKDDIDGFRRDNRPHRPVCEISLQPFALSCSGG